MKRGKIRETPHFELSYADTVWVVPAYPALVQFDLKRGAAPSLHRGGSNERSRENHVGDFRPRQCRSGDTIVSCRTAARVGLKAVAAPAPSAPASTTASASLPKAATPVDVADILTKLAAKNKEKLNWRLSIVDLMKLLNLDSSLAARKELADELHYTGDKNDSATMNMWLHKQVMQKLAENGGKVPDELRK